MSLQEAIILACDESHFHLQIAYNQEREGYLRGMFIDSISMDGLYWRFSKDGKFLVNIIEIGKTWLCFTNNFEDTLYIPDHVYKVEKTLFEFLIYIECSKISASLSHCLNKIKNYPGLRQTVGFKSIDELNSLFEMDENIHIAHASFIREFNRYIESGKRERETSPDDAVARKLEEWAILGYRAFLMNIYIEYSAMFTVRPDARPSQADIDDFNKRKKVIMRALLHFHPDHHRDQEVIATMITKHLNAFKDE